MLQKLNNYRLLVYVPLNVLTFLGIYYSFTSWDYIFVDLIVFLIGWFLITGLGAAVGMHRIFAHRTHNLTGWVKKFVLFCTTMSCEGPTIWWSSVHRGLHHRHADTENDPHSPIHGWYHSIIGWISKEKIDKHSLRYAPDLLRDKDHRFFQKYYNFIIPLVWLSVGVSLGYKTLFLLLLLPAFIGMWRDSLENAITHSPKLGYRNFETKDKSSNVLWMVPFGFGNAFHNNHHYNPSSFDFGSGISGKWWEFDLSRVFLFFLKKYENKK